MHYTSANSVPSPLLQPVVRALNALVSASRPYGGLFPSLLDRRTGAMLSDLPPPIPGQRNADRSHLGCNLMHDESVLRTLYALAQVLGRPDYAETADAYLATFATRCTDTATGLFPWGEHSFWHLLENRVGNSYVYHDGNTPGRPATHDHLRQAPLWLWEKLHALSPRAVMRFAEGLDFHWVAGEPREYIRHAPIDRCEHPKRGERSCDFPRHGGFYIFDWAFAWTRTGRPDFLKQIRDMLDYWWDKRDARGLLGIESRSPEESVRFFRIQAPGQTLSLATSLLETANLVAAREPDVAATLRARGRAYLDGFFAAPHDLAKSVFVILSRRDDNTVVEAMPIWGSRYGLWPASYVALTCLCAFRFTRDPRLLAWAEAVGGAYQSAPFPADTAVPAMDAGLGLGLLVDLYDLTGEKRWRDAGLALAPLLVAAYLDADLPRGAAGIAWYESQMGPGFLLHALARLALLADGNTPCVLAADYTAR
jgi:hypothetical protein